MSKAGFIILEGASEPEKPRILTNNAMSIKIDTNLQSTSLNRNGRVYPDGVLNEALLDDYIKERMTTKTWFGEAGHPRTADPKRILDYDQHNLSHIVLDTKWQGSILKGIVETANTSIGRDMKGLIEQGSKVAFSLRALGSVDKTQAGILEVKSPLKMFCYDWVIHPSHKEAYMENILSESTSAFSVDDLILEESGQLIEIPLTEDEIKNLIIDAGDVNVASILDQFEMSMLTESDSVILQADKKTVLIESEGKKVIANLDQYSTETINSYLRSKI